MKLTVTTIIITGGTGFLGGKLSYFLSANPGFRIIVFTRKDAGIFSNLPNVEVINVDHEDEDRIAFYCLKAQVIIHLASYNMNDAANNPEAALEFSEKYTINLLKGADKSQVRLFISISTVHVYGSNSEKEPVVVDESSPLNPLSPYAVCHQHAEEIIRNFSSSGFKSCILRLANCFGAPVSKHTDCWKLLVPDLCRQVFETGRVEINSDGEQYRDFLPLTSFCSLIFDLIRANEQIFADKVNCYNITSAKNIQVREMAELIKERSKILFGKDIAIRFNSSVNGDPRYFIYSNRKINEKIILRKPDIENEIDNLLIFCQKNFNRQH